MIQLAAEHDLENAREIMERVLESVSHWDYHAAANGIPPATADQVAALHRLTL